MFWLLLYCFFTHWAHIHVVILRVMSTLTWISSRSFLSGIALAADTCFSNNLRSFCSFLVSSFLYSSNLAISSALICSNSKRSDLQHKQQSTNVHYMRKERNNTFYEIISPKRKQLDLTLKRLLPNTRCSVFIFLLSFYTCIHSLLNRLCKEDHITWEFPVFSRSPVWVWWAQRSPS